MGCYEINIRNAYYTKIREIGQKDDLYQSFLVRSSETNNEYAYKYIDISALNKNTKKDLLYIIEYLKKINHPNMIELKYAYYSENQKLNVFIEYSDKGTLKMKLDEQKTKGQYFDENTLINWFYQICLALKYIHSIKFLHKNINPSNIFLMNDNFAKLGIVGLENGFIPNIIQSKRKVNPYLAPEIRHDEYFTYKSDIWVLGTTFYQLIILDYPFEGESFEEMPRNIESGIKKPNSKRL